MPDTSETAEYRCPGDRMPITRSVHLGRLARFYPPCRRCRHRGDTGFVPAPRARRLAEFLERGEPEGLFVTDRVSGKSLDDLDPRVARRVGAAFGVILRRTRAGSPGRPAVAVAYDGRAVTAEVMAGGGEGLRWSGATVIDLGPATAGLVVRTVSEAGWDGGLLVGGPGSGTGSIGMRFWCDRGRPLDPESLAQMATMGASGVDRPTRKYGPLRRVAARAPYLAELAESYHGLRPLRMVLRSDCPAAAAHLAELAAGTACRFLACHGDPGRLGHQLRLERAHVAVQIEDDGQRCGVTDDRGRPVPGDRLLLLLARWVLRQRPAAVVAEAGTRPDVLRHLEKSGVEVATSRPEPFAMHRSMGEHGARLGGGPSGRFWYRGPGDWITADAVRTVTHLLRILSQSDRPLSEVLDAEAPVGYKQR